MAQNTINNWWPTAKEKTDLTQVCLRLEFKRGRKIDIQPLEIREKAGRIRVIYLSPHGRRRSISGATKLIAVLPQ